MAIETLLSDFPEVTLAFAYGSAVFTQEDNEDTKNNMLDVVFVVDDALEWHKANLEINRSHYSVVGRVFRPELIASLQDNFGANMYFNTLVPWNGRIIKYGVISKKSFIDDLVNWMSLYVSGRLHKPVKFLRFCPSDIDSFLNTNLKHALRTSLLCLPDQFSDEELFLHITNLSYAGDFRMLIGEHKNKVSNIVIPNMEHFRKLYHPLLHDDESICIDKSIIHQKCDVKTRYQHLKCLPQNLKSRIVNWRMSGLRFQPFNMPSNEMQDAILYSLAHDREKTSELTIKGTRSIVRRTSISQSLKGIITAGMFKSFVYSGKKLGKMFRGMLK
jgi:translocator assembly and maintenance protein 41